MNNMYRISFLIFIVTALASAKVNATPPQLETIEQELVSNWNKLRSLSATIHIQAEMYTKIGRVTSEGDGLFAIDRADGKEKFYKQLKTEATNEYNGTPLVTHSAGVSVTIDNITQSMTNSVDKKYVIRKKATPIDRRDAPAMLKMMKQKGSVRLLDSQSLDNRKTHVIETQYTVADNLITRMVVHFDSQTGVAVRITTYDRQGIAVNISTLTLKAVNKDVRKSLFEWPMAEDATMVDLTKDKKNRP